MKIVNPSVEIIHPPAKLDGMALAPDESMIHHIERCGRVCYKSESFMANDTAADFVSRIIKRGHEAVLEHASFCFVLTSPAQILVEDTIERVQRFSPFDRQWNQKDCIRKCPCMARLFSHASSREYLLPQLLCAVHLRQSCSFP